MKPDWKDAPEWANWLAMDYNRQWYWYELEPVKYHSRFWNDSGGRLELAKSFNGWEETKEKRP